MIITIANRKGGTAKSTTAVYLACALAREGDRVLIVDADPQGSILSWSEEAGDFPAAVVSWPTRDLAKRVRDISDAYRHIVIDTGRPPGGGGEDPILRGALIASDQLIIPFAPTLMDVRELARVLDMVDEIETVSPVAVHLLMTKVRAGTTSARQAREALEAQSLPLFRVQVGLRESYASSWGTTPASLEEYAYVLEELLAGVTV